MQRNSKLISSLFIIGVSIAIMSWCFFSQKKDSPALLNHKDEERYFEEVTIDYFSSTQHPILTIEIEGKSLLAKLDLGLNGGMNLSPRILSEINKKSFLRPQVN